jgi:hypothetical protein
MPDAPFDVEISGSYAYVAARQSGVQVLDVSDPSFPRIAGTVPTPGEPLGLFLTPSFLYVGDGSSGLAILAPQCPAPSPRSSPPAGAGFVSVSPIPARGGQAVRIRVATRWGGPARIRLYDIEGRLVRVLGEAFLKPGVHVLSWDGRDGRGRYASGVYLARISVGGRSETVRIVLVR